MRGLLNSTSYFALRTPDGVGGGTATAPDNAASATAGGGPSAPQPSAAEPAPPADGAGNAGTVAASTPTAAGDGAPAGQSAGTAGAATGASAANDAAGAAGKEAQVAPNQPHAPSLLESAKGKDAAADGAAKPADGAAAKETPAVAGKETVAAEPAKEPAKEPSAETGAEKAKAGDAAPEVKPPEPVKYDAFKVPETVKLEEDRLKAFTDIVGPAQVKQEVAQALVDLHTNEIQRAFQLAEQNQRDYWTKQIDTWKTETRKDPEIGGNRLETSLSIAKAVVEEFLSADEQKEFFAHISETRGNGMGNYVLFNKLFNRIGVRMNIFEDSIVPAASAPGGRSKEPGQRGWYGNAGERRASAG